VPAYVVAPLRRPTVERLAEKTPKTPPPVLRGGQTGWGPSSEGEQRGGRGGGKIANAH